MSVILAAGAIAGALLAVIALATIVVKALRRSIRRVEEAEVRRLSKLAGLVDERIAPVLAEFQPNHGSSFRDLVERRFDLLDNRVALVDRRVERLDNRVERLEGSAIT